LTVESYLDDDSTFKVLKIIYSEAMKKEKSVINLD